MDQAATTPKDLAGAVLSIDLGAIQKNWRTLKAHAGSAECGAAVKGNAYVLGLDPRNPAHLALLSMVGLACPRA